MSNPLSKASLMEGFIRTQDVATPGGRPVPLCHGLWEGKEGEKEGREGSENYFKRGVKVYEIISSEPSTEAT